MNSTGRDLARWDAFAKAHLAGGPQYQFAAKFQLFRSRWRLAWNFKGFDATGFSDTTVDAYATAFKVFLAYSAHELLADTLNAPHTKIEYENSELAERVRIDLASMKQLTLDYALGKQVGFLTRFWNGETDDIRPFAYGVRNVVTHGPFTANKVRSKAARNCLLEVAEHILLTTEECFCLWTVVLETEFGNAEV